MTADHKAAESGIWGFALGYFLCYIPYSALTKALSSGMPEKLDRGIPGFELLPVSVGVSMVTMLVFITAMRWWKYANHRQVLGLSIPTPTRWTFLSGLCTSGIIATTTMAYTFEGVSIVFMMLLMRGGVLILAPIVDVISGRHVRWFSGMALALSLGALVVAFAGKGGFTLSLIATIDISLYLTCYFVRFSFMSKLAKSDDLDVRTRYFVEEQMVASPFLFATLCVLALVDTGESLHMIHAGFTSFLDGPVVKEAMLIGLLSQGTGIFGSLIFLDKRENAFCVPVNRSSSIMAGVLAAYSLHWFLDGREPDGYQLAGAGLIIGAILFLTIPSLLAKRRAAAA